MSTKKKTKTKVKNNKKKQPRNIKLPWLLIVVIALIAIPGVIFGGILLSAQMQTGIPQIGDRFDGQLTNELTSDDMNIIKENVSAIEGVESVTVEFKVATVRIYIDNNDDASKESIKALNEAAYAALDALYPIADYFTTTEDGISQYDLEIYGYNVLEGPFETEENPDGLPVRYIYRLVKNSPQDKFLHENISTPRDKGLVDQLYADEAARDAEEAAAEEAEENNTTEDGTTTE
ncbi:MAG: hypothetical protein ACK5G7_06070 [Erysipelotrichaceae bacterium]